MRLDQAEDGIPQENFLFYFELRYCPALSRRLKRKLYWVVSALSVQLRRIQTNAFISNAATLKSRRFTTDLDAVLCPESRIYYSILSVHSVTRPGQAKLMKG